MSMIMNLRKNAEKFLKEGAKLKAFVFFKGRSIIYKDQGQILLLRLADLEFGKVEADASS
jgi:translation initiation factor IF-3